MLDENNILSIHAAGLRDPESMADLDRKFRSAVNVTLKRPIRKTNMILVLVLYLAKAAGAAAGVLPRDLDLCKVA